MIEQNANPKPKVTRRTKVVIVVVFLLVGLVGLYVGGPLQRFRSSEENAVTKSAPSCSALGDLSPHTHKVRLGRVATTARGSASAISSCDLSANP